MRREPPPPSLIPPAADEDSGSSSVFDFYLLWVLSVNILPLTLTRRTSLKTTAEYFHLIGLLFINNCCSHVRCWSWPVSALSFDYQENVKIIQVQCCFCSEVLTSHDVTVSRWINLLIGGHCAVWDSTITTKSQIRLASPKCPYPSLLLPYYFCSFLWNIWGLGLVAACWLSLKVHFVVWRAEEIHDELKMWNMNRF